MKKQIIFFIISIFLIGCQDKQNLPQQLISQVKESSPLYLKFKFEANGEGKLIVVFDKIEHYNETVTYKVFGNMQEGYNLFEAHMFADHPSHLVQINFGRMKERIIVIKSIVLGYHNKTININKTKLLQYFNINEYIDYNPNTGELKTKRINDRLIPMITLKKAVTDKLIDLN